MNKENNHSANVNGSWKEKLRMLEGSVCEGLQLDQSISESTNLYGRKLLLNNGFSYISGLTLSGLRTSAIIDGNDPEEFIPQIRAGIRQLLPVTIHIDKSVDGQFMRKIMNPELLPFFNAAQLVPASAQETLDFSLIAHKVSELTLSPVINQIHVMGNGDYHEVSKAGRLQYLGNTEDRIECPTPAQRLIFGNTRRRIPQWFNYDYPAQIGTLKDQRSIAFEFAAKEVYFRAHLNEILSHSFEELKTISGRKYDFVTAYNSERSPHLIITVGYNMELSVPVIDELNNNKINAGFANLSVINPFPESQILELIQGKKAVTIFEPLGNHSNWLVSRVRELTGRLKNPPEIITGYFHGNLKIADILAAAANMKSDQPIKSYYCCIPFTRSSSHYPKHKVMLEAIQREYPQLIEQSITSENTVKPGVINENTRISPLITKYKDRGAPFTQLSRFYDNTALFYQNGNSGEMVADPFQAIPSVPAASAALKSMSGDNTFLPEINKQNCTACGNCMVYCPHSALPSAAIGIESLLKAGMDMATHSGEQIIGLIPLIRNLAKLASKKVASNTDDNNQELLESILPKAFEKLISQSNFESEKVASLEKEFSFLLGELDGLPAIFSKSLYYNPESQQKGNGELFILAVDPDSCTGCGICMEVCEDEAIQMVSEEKEKNKVKYKGLEIWEKLPDTSTDTINRLLHDKEYNSFAALMLSRNFYHSMMGGSRLENELPSKHLVHLISAVSESLMQPRYHEFSNETGSLIKDLSENIHKILSEALPKENFDNIASAIEESSGDKMPFEKIIGNVGKEERLKQLDSGILKRKIELLKALKGLKWSIDDGPTGSGRARNGLTIIDNQKFNWSNQYPDNPFISPVLTYQNDFSPTVILGIMDGQIRNIIDNLKLLRKAQLEIKDKYVSKQHDKEIAKLGWEDLNDGEKKLIPPLILVADQEQVAENSFDTIGQLLNSRIPVKIFVLDDLVPSPSKMDKENVKASELISLISLRKAFVYQGSMANPGSLFENMAEGLHSFSPAYFRIFSPSPLKHNLKTYNWPSLSSLACNTRSIPYLKFNPEHFSGILNSSISIEDNPSSDEEWVSGSLDYKTNSEDDKITQNFNMTWADWAFTIKEWRSHFTLLEDKEDDTTVHVSEFISSDDTDNVAVIYRIKDNKLVKYALSTEVVERTRAVKESWILFQEISGNRVEFPEKLSKKIRDDLQKDFDREVEKMKVEYDDRLKEMKHKEVEAIRKKLRDKLVQFANRKNLKGNDS